MSSQISHFMQCYCDAWNQLNGKAIAYHYKDKAKIIDGDGAAQYSSDALVRKFESNCQQLVDMNFKCTEFEWDEINETSLFAKVVWLVKFKEQSVKFGMSYQLINDKDELKIAQAKMYSIPIE